MMSIEIKLKLIVLFSRSNTKYSILLEKVSYNWDFKIVLLAYIL